MNIDPISPSILHVTAKSNLHIEDDLEATQTKSLAELITQSEKLDEEKEKSQDC